MTKSFYLVHQGLRWEEKEILTTARNSGLNIQAIDLSNSLWLQTSVESQSIMESQPYFLVRTPSFFHSLQVSQWCEAQQALTLNKAANLELFGQKLSTYSWAKARRLNVLPVWLGLTASAIKEASVNFEYPIVVKQNIGGFGKLVRLITTPQELVNDAELIFSYAPTSHRCLLIQPYLELNQDLRVTILNKKPLSVIQRLAKAGEFRHNVAEGAEAKKVTPSIAVQSLIDRICEEIPLGFYGVDIFEGKCGNVYLNEINAVPLFHASSTAASVNIAAEFIKALISEPI